MAIRVGPMDMLAGPEGTTSDLRADWRQKRRTALARQHAIQAMAFRTEAQTDDIGRRRGYAEQLLDLETQRLTQSGAQFGETMKARGTEFKGLQDYRMAGRGIEESAEERMATGQRARIDWQTGGPAREEAVWRRRNPIEALLAEEIGRGRGARQGAIGEGRALPGGDVEPRGDIFGVPMEQILRGRLGLPGEGQRKLTEAQTGLALTQTKQAQRALADPAAQRTPDQNALIERASIPALSRFTEKLQSLKSAWNVLGADDIQEAASSAAEYAKMMQQLRMTENEVATVLAQALEDEMRGFARYFSGDAADNALRDELRRQIDAAVKRAFLGGAETAIQEAGVRRAQPAPQFGPPALPGPGGGATPADIRLG